MKYELYAVDKAGIADLIFESDSKNKVEAAAREYIDNEEELSEITDKADVSRLFIKEWLS